MQNKVVHVLVCFNLFRRVFWPQYMYHKMSSNYGFCWCPLGKLSHPGLEQLFCIATRSERWCHRRARFLTAIPIVTVIHNYCFCVRHWRDTPVFWAYAGTVRDSDDGPHSIRFDTDYYRIGIENFASGCMSPNRDHFITYKASEGQ